MLYFMKMAEWSASLLTGEIRVRGVISRMLDRNIIECKWIGQIFEAKIVRRGGIVRRKIASVRKYASVEALELAVKVRGFHMTEAGGQYIIYCNAGNIRLNC